MAGPIPRRSCDELTGWGRWGREELRGVDSGAGAEEEEWEVGWGVWMGKGVRGDRGEL